MKFVSLFAGVGGFDLGLEQSGHVCVGQVEIDPNAMSVLKEHWPNVPKHDDVTTAIDWADEIGITGTVDYVVGGFPCQDVSVAGRRAGLAGKRSGLFFDALAFATHVKAKTIILENVPGLLTSNQGRDFGTVLTELADAGYSNVEWRVFDSQWFGVPQRRRRIFIVASSGNGSFKQILTERSNGIRNTAQGKKQTKDTSRSTGKSFAVYGQSGYADYDLGVKTLNASMYKRPDDSVVVFSPRFDEVIRLHDSKIAPTVAAYYGTGGNNMPMFADGVKVRRLTPLECERLQGFPDNWTASQADTHRYKQMGNAVTVNVIKWIGSRI
jgi:DNA (cytosine-5)-methyltransferase 1